MGFFRNLIGAGVGAFSDVANDSMFREFVVLPEHKVTQDVLAVRGEIMTKNPDGSKASKNRSSTGVISDGSKVVVPQGFVAVMVADGKFIEDVAPAGSYVWNTGENPLLVGTPREEGMLRKGIVQAFKDRFAYGGMVAQQQDVIFLRLQPIVGHKFGTASPVEYESAKYKGTMLDITFRGMYSFIIGNPVAFFVNFVSGQMKEGVFKTDQINKDNLRADFIQNLTVSISRFLAKEQKDIPALNGMMKEFSDFACKDISVTWDVLYGLNIIDVKLEDIGYTTDSRERIKKMDEMYFRRDSGTFEMEKQMAMVDAMKIAAGNEGNGNGMNMIMGMNMGQAFGGMMGQAMQPNYGYPPQGMPPQYGYPPQGMPPQYGYQPQYGYPPQGMPPQGMPPQGMPPQGMPPQGMPPQYGYQQQGMPPQGIPPQDMQQQPSWNTPQNTQVTTNVPNPTIDTPSQAQNNNMQQGMMGNIPPQQGMPQQGMSQQGMQTNVPPQYNGMPPQYNGMPPQYNGMPPQQGMSPQDPNTMQYNGMTQQVMPNSMPPQGTSDYQNGLSPNN